MTVRIYLNTSSKRAETSALLDTGATENFMSLSYAQRMQLPTAALETPRRVFNVDGSENKAGTITHYTDLSVQTGQRRTLLRFFLTNIGGQDVILGYPWFVAIEPKIVWGRGWIDYTHLPIVMRTHDAQLARMVTRTIQRWRPLRARLTQARDRQTLASKLAEQTQPKITILPECYKRHARVFSEEESQRFPPARPWDHAIELLKDAPKAMPGKIYALTQTEQKAMEDFLKEHLKKGYIRPSKSRYAAPFFFVKKKDGKLRPVQDYRKLNEWTIRNTYPLPLIPELIARVKGAALFSKFDIRWGYNNIRIRQGDKWKAAFIMNKGLFEPKVMFFGLTNSLATFQTMMNAIFEEELREDWLTIYMDDILIHTKDDVEYHRGKVHHILDKLQKNDLFLKLEKCSFEQTEMEFLRVILGPGTIHMDPAKLKGIADWSPPRTVKGVRAFLGFTGFYRYFIPGYSQIARPLIDLTKKDTPWHWWEPQMKAFETLKTLMCRQPILRQPDYTKQFFLATDASAYGMGAVLLQEGDLNPHTKLPTRHPIAYYSATFTPTEQNYDIYERELLAVIKALAHWRPHLAGTETPVLVLTDHANLTFWKAPRKVNRRVARWFSELQEYNLQIKHVPGKLHHAADLLSRPPQADHGETDSENVTLLDKKLFIRLLTEPEAEWMDLEQKIAQVQERERDEVNQWKANLDAQLDPSTTVPNLRLWTVKD